MFLFLRIIFHATVSEERKGQNVHTDTDVHSANSSPHLLMFSPYMFHLREFVLFEGNMRGVEIIKVYGRFSLLFVSAGERSAEGKEEL